MKSANCPKYEQKNLKNSALSIQDKNFQIFRSYFGQCDDFIHSFWNLLTFRLGLNRYDSILITYKCCILCSQHRLRRLRGNPFRECMIKGCVNHKSDLTEQGRNSSSSRDSLPTLPFLSPATQRPYRLGYLTLYLLWRSLQ